MLVFAHRGASADFPENTLLAIGQALEMGVDGIEIDVHEVAGELLVFHDRWLSRTTNGQGRLQDCNIDYLRQLDAGQGQQIPTLWEVMQCIDGRCILNIELKGPHSLTPLIECIERALAELSFGPEQLLVSAFDHIYLQQLKIQRADILIGALTASCPIDYARFAQQLGAYSLHIVVDCLRPELIWDAKRAGLKVIVFTVDELVDIDELDAMGVDGIFTNKPLQALRHLGRSSQSVG